MLKESNKIFAQSKSKFLPNWFSTRGDVRHRPTLRGLARTEHKEDKSRQHFVCGIAAKHTSGESVPTRTFSAESLMGNRNAHTPRRGQRRVVRVGCGHGC